MVCCKTTVEKNEKKEKKLKKYPKKLMRMHLVLSLYILEKMFSRTEEKCICMK